MSFLDQYDEIPESNVKARVGLFFKHLRGDWQGLFEELRKNRPVLVVPPFIFITRWIDVVDVLSRHETFTVTQNRRSMDPSVGPFMLARDGQVENWHEKSVMRMLLRREDLPRIRKNAGKVADAALKGHHDRVELVSKVGRLVPVRVVQDYFGFKGLNDDGPSDADILRWSRATQHDMFRNFPVNDDVHDVNVKAGKDMRDWLKSEIKERQRSDTKGDDVFSRLLRLTSCDTSVLELEQVVSNVCGLLVGAIETTSQAIVQSVEQILKRPAVAKAAIKAAEDGDNKVLDAIVWEALRFNPITTFVIRVASIDASIAPGTPHQMPVKAGMLVAPCTGSAMFDDGMFDKPNIFHAGRPAHNYLHLGFGHHECLGKHVGLEIIPEAVRHILLLPGVHLLGGDEGKIDFGKEADGSKGPFPERFFVGHT